MNNIVTLKYGLEVTQIIKVGTIRKFGCGFQFAFHSNYGSILHHFGDKARYWSKIIFSYPLAFDAPVRRVPVGIVPWRLVRKNWNGLATRRWKIEDTFIRFHMIHERDGRTHRQTDRHSDRHRMTTGRAYAYCVAKTYQSFRMAQFSMTVTHIQCYAIK